MARAWGKMLCLSQRKQFMTKKRNHRQLPLLQPERSSSVRIDRDRKTILVHMLWVLLFVGKARKTSFGVGSLPIDAVATRSRRKSSCYLPPLLSSMSHQTDSISVCGSARRQSIGKDEDKEEPFSIHRSEQSKWKADKRNSVQLQGSVLSSVPGPFFSCVSRLDRQFSQKEHQKSRKKVSGAFFTFKQYLLYPGCRLRTVTLKLYILMLVKHSLEQGSETRQFVTVIQEVV